MSDIIEPSKHMVVTSWIEYVQEIGMEEIAPVDEAQSNLRPEHFQRRVFVRTGGGLYLLIFTSEKENNLRLVKREKK